MSKMVKTEVINNSDRDLKLKEGNAGVFRDLALLPKKRRYSITCNTDATYREYWVGMAVKDDAVAQLTISSDDCAEYETISIINDPDDHEKLKLDCRNKRGGANTEVFNRTDGDVTLIKTKVGNEQTQRVIKKDDKFIIQPGPKDCKYSVEAGGHDPIPITYKEVAKAQRINIISDSVDNTTPAGKAKLDLVSRGLFLMEVMNKTSTDIELKHCEGDEVSNAGQLITTLQKDEKYTIRYDPKKKPDHKFSCTVAYASAAAGTSTLPSERVLDLTSTDFADYERIDVIEGKSPGTHEIVFEKQARLTTATIKKSLMSRFLGVFGYNK